MNVKVKVAQSCLTLCDPMDPIYSPWNSPGQNPGVGSHSLLQGIVPMQGLNPGLPHCRPEAVISDNHWFIPSFMLPMCPKGADGPEPRACSPWGGYVLTTDLRSVLVMGCVWNFQSFLLGGLKDEAQDEQCEGCRRRCHQMDSGWTCMHTVWPVKILKWIVNRYPKIHPKIGAYVFPSGSLNIILWKHLVKSSARWRSWLFWVK